MPTKLKHSHLQRYYNYAGHATDLAEEREEISQATPAQTGHPELRQAALNPKGATHGAILGLQARYGNQAVQRILANSTGGQVQRVGRQRGKAFLGVKSDRNDEELILGRLRNPELKQLFWAYSIKEMSAENVEALYDIQDYKISPNMPRARRIFNQYITRNSVKELNLSSAIVVETNNRMQNATTSGNASPDLFDKVQEGIMVNILDTWSRFRISDGYQEWEENHPQF